MVLTASIFMKSWVATVVCNDSSFSGCFMLVSPLVWGESTGPQGFLCHEHVLCLIRSVSPYRLYTCCTLSGLMLPQTMCDPVTGPGTVTAVVQTMGSTLVTQHLRSMTWIRFPSPLGHSCQSFELKSLTQNDAPSNC